MIKQRTMGRTSLQVSELCLGTMNFGWKTDESKSFAILDAYRAAGGNFLQATAHCPSLGLPAASTAFSESMVGRWWRSRAIPRTELVLATRIYVGDGATDELALARRVFSCCMESLARFQTTYLDLVILEWSESLLPIGETLKAFDVLIRSGIARYVGTANFPIWRVADMIGRAPLGNSSRMELIQSDYSLMTRARFEPEAMSLCEEQKLGFIARSPLAGGFLARQNGDRSSPSRRDWLRLRFGNRHSHIGLAAVNEVAARLEISPAQVALAWVLHNPVVTSALIGVNSPAHLHDLQGAGEVEFSMDDLNRLSGATNTELVRLTA
jgi:aryl-alcohol dehydrogenase-like predicted oxidoreductase